MEAMLMSIMGILRRYLQWAGHGMERASPQQVLIERCKCGDQDNEGGDEVPILPQYSYYGSPAILLICKALHKFREEKYQRLFQY